MSVVSTYLRHALSRDARADEVVPPTGITAHLIIFAAATMAFLAVFALALSLSAGRLAQEWERELGRTMTVRIVAPIDQRATQTQAALMLLQATRGVAEARVLTDEEQRALLAPWFGTEFALNDLPMPSLIEVIEDDSGVDVSGLRLQLSGQIPGAVLDDHGGWRAPLEQAARHLRWLGWICVLLIGGALATMIALATQAALAANVKVIDVLRLVGATDSYIVGAFVRRFTWRAAFGAGLGVFFGVVVLMAFPPQPEPFGVLAGLHFKGFSWIFPLAIPIFAALVSFAATSSAATRRLKRVL
ncbi:MAG: FtsX-like permease family protein [Pseudomonadota bacterium]